MTSTSDQERRDDELLANCTRQLCWRPRVSPAELLQTLANDVDAHETYDTYGRGGIVDDTEQLVAEALGKQGALLFVTGVMAQLCALRIWCERKGNALVGYHPQAHFEEREEGALSRLHNIERVHLGSRDRLMTVNDIHAAPPRLSAIVLELPQRDLGGTLPDWEALVEQTDAIGARGAAAHLDGARLFEAQTAYARPLAEIAGQFDSVYVSAYKGLGAFAGAFLAGDADFLEEARVWRRRHGGECFQLFPFAVAARHAWRQRIDAFGEFRAHAETLCAALLTVDGIRLAPDVPQTNMVHVFLDVSVNAARAAAVAIAKSDDVCLFRRVRPIEFPNTCAFELPFHEGALAFSPDEIAPLFSRFMEKARAFDAASAE